MHLNFFQKRIWQGAVAILAMKHATQHSRLIMKTRKAAVTRQMMGIETVIAGLPQPLCRTIGGELILEAPEIQLEVLYGSEVIVALTDWTVLSFG